MSHGRKQAERPGESMARLSDRLELLRARYAALREKYDVLVERLDRRTDERLAVYQLGYLGLQIAGAALAVVRGDRITQAAAAFPAIEAIFRRGRTWTRVGDPARRYKNLRKMLVAEAGLYPKRLREVAIHRFRGEEEHLTLELRLKRAGGEVAILVTDVSASARAADEMASTRTALLQKERLRILGVLAASVAHDLGTTLRAGALYVGALQRRYRDGQVQAELAQLASTIESASETIDRLHTFANSGRLAASIPIDLGRMLSDALAVVAMQARGRNVRLRADIGRLPPVRATPGELSHLFVNVLINAVEAMPGGGTVSLRARKSRRGAVVAVADQGVGISEANRRRLFQPFFTTKGSSGTGLGLWLAAGTVARIGGAIRCDSQPGKGTTFTIELPAAAASPAARSDEAAARSAPGRVRPRR